MTKKQIQQLIKKYSKAWEALGDRDKEGSPVIKKSMDKYTSLELSRKLAENGCKLESDWFWSEHTEPPTLWREDFLEEETGARIGNQYPAYDILNDICVKYAKEFFGKNRIRKIEIINTIFVLLSENKKQEAEDYLWEHCKFNPKNK